MGLRQPALSAVPLRSSFRAYLNWKPNSLHMAIERPAAGVHRQSILQRTPRLDLHRGTAKLSRCLCPLGGTARFTGQGKIASPLCAVACPGPTLLHLKRYVRCRAVGAGTFPVLQPVGITAH